MSGTAKTQGPVLTVNLTTRAHEALARAADATGDSKGDTMCSALLVYGAIVEALADGTQQLTFERRDGELVGIILPAGYDALAVRLLVAVVAAAVFAAVAVGLGIALALT